MGLVTIIYGTVLLIVCGAFDRRKRK